MGKINIFIVALCFSNFFSYSQERPESGAYLIRSIALSLKPSAPENLKECIEHLAQLDTNQLSVLFTHYSFKMREKCGLSVTNSQVIERVAKEFKYFDRFKTYPPHCLDT